ncbi:hypothetical protein [Microbacterium karelineae]|uniref:hypothetical protein n=1 Tax=Microbacterium karelineae TaxID=2654283 RepID=UPI0012EABE8F|nr:hypothetical protein [Microbacterium karelineae]
MSAHGLASMQDFRRASRNDAPIIRRAERMWPMLIGWGILSILFGALGVFVMMLTYGSRDPSAREAFLAGLAIVGFALLLIGTLVVVWVNHRKRWRVRRAAAEMALTHGWHYELEVDPGLLTGSLFRCGTRARVENAMHVHAPRFVEIGNHTFVAPQGQSFKGLDQIGYIRVLLDRSLPHMHLPAQGRTGVRPYTIGFDRAQLMDLEGDFNRYWRLFVPKGYEQDAYYVFTPDLMATLVDWIPGCDVEIIDDEMFIYAPGPFDLTRPEILEAAQIVADTVGAHTAQRSSRYSDEQSAHPDLVGSGGARLKPTSAWALRIVPAVAGVGAGLAVAWQGGIFG